MRPLEVAVVEALAAGPDLPAALDAYSRARRRNLRFYARASRLLTPMFQSRADPLALARDALTLPVSRIPWVRRQMLESLAGVKTGVLSRLGDEWL